MPRRYLFLFTVLCRTGIAANPAKTANERCMKMKLAIIIVGIITIVGSVFGTVYAIIHEIRKDQKKQPEENNTER